MRLHLLRNKYAFHLLKWVRMANCKPIATLISLSEKLLLHEWSSLGINDATSYRIIGVFQYLTLVIPDITFSINKTC